jgi:DNA-binding NtrC family response regulator
LAAVVQQQAWFGGGTSGCLAGGYPVARILLIDDDADLRGFVESALKALGHEVTSRESADGVPELLSEDGTDVVLLDNKLPGVSGVEFLEVLEQRSIHLPVILMTGDPTTDTAIQAMNFGAFDYVVKPFELDALIDELEPLLAKALEIGRPMKEQVLLPGEGTAASGATAQMLGNSRAMREVYKLIGRVARSDAPVLILGETGTGKELVAKAIHSNSPRRDRPFVALNCTAFNENLLDDELFGHEPGAFTGAAKLRKGRLEYAHGGTLFLDEIGDMPEKLQSKLLRVLEYQQVERIGGNDPIQVDVRVLSATHRDLNAAVEQKKFRQDLLFRLNRVCIELPPLRERGPDDLRLLTQYFLERAASGIGRAPPTVTADAWERLLHHSWPGNIRQLQNVVSRAVLVSPGTQIGVEHIDVGLSGPSEEARPTGEAGLVAPSDEIVASLARAARLAIDSGQADLYQHLHTLLERELLRLTLDACGNNQVQTAKRLGLSRGGLRAKMQAHGMLPGEGPSVGPS